MKSLDQDTAGYAIVEQELRLLARVTDAISAISGQTVGSPDFDAELIELRNQIAESKPEDIAPLVEQMTRISALARRYGKGRDLPVDPGSPYFAHLRLEEDERRRDVLIGKRGLIDRQRNVQIVDWRNAPVSRIYYRYEEGDDYEERFGDRVASGTVEVRRNLTIEEGQLRRIGCQQGTFIGGTDGTSWFEADAVHVPELSGGQGKASRPPVLARGTRGSKLGAHSGSRLRADKHLPEIAALIDRTQFELITRPESGLIVLQGGAGTGKTTVALHRIAYLSYSRPKLFRPNQMLVVVPSRAMAHYVERVLPSLEVRGIRVVTASFWFERTRRQLLPQTTNTYNSETPVAVQQLKKHPLLLTVMREHVEQQAARFGNEIEHVLTADPATAQLVEPWRTHAARPLIPRLTAFSGQLAATELPVLTRQRLEALLTRLTARACDVVSDLEEVLTHRSLLEQAVARLAPGEITSRQLDQVCRWCADQVIEREESAGKAEVEDPEAYIAADGRQEQLEAQGLGLDADDDALLLYLCWLKQGELRKPRPARGKPSQGGGLRYDHLVIDEAQDLSAVQLKVLIETTRPRYSVTIAGDTAQRLVFDNGFSNWEALLDRLGMQAASNTTLELGYRSTDEVMTLARSLLGEAAPGPTPRSARSGAPVELHRFGNQGEAVAMLAEALRSLMMREPLASVALIARHAGLAAAWADDLRRAEVPSIRLVRGQDFSFRPGIEITDVAQVKGLEFDYVVILDAMATSYPATLESRHLLHIAATRAAHQLWMLSVGTPSPLLPSTVAGAAS